MLKNLKFAFLLLLVPAIAGAQGADLGEARAMVQSMQEIVGEVERFAEETREDAIKQTCVAGAHREMGEVIASVEKALEEAAGQGPEARAQALRTVEAGMTTVQQLRTEMYDCVGPEELGPGGTPAPTYDPVKSARERETVGVPALRPPAASSVQ